MSDHNQQSNLSLSQFSTLNKLKNKKSNSYQIEQMEEQGEKVLINKKRNHFQSEQLNDNFVNNYNVCVNILNQYGISNSDEIKYDILNMHQTEEKTRLNQCFSANPILRHPQLNSMGQLGAEMRNKISFKNGYDYPTRHQNNKLQKYQKLPSLDTPLSKRMGLQSILEQKDKAKNVFKSQQRLVDKIFSEKKDSL